MALDLSLEPGQQMLRDGLRRFLADNAWPGWRSLSDALGLGGVAVPEGAGGFGGGMRDIALVMGELAPAHAGADWLSHAVASWLLGRAAPAHPALPGLATGSRRAAILCPASSAALPAIDERGVPRGTATLVAGGAGADLLLFAADEAILLIAARRDKVEQRHRIMLDGSVTADLCFALEPGDAEPLASGAAARALGDLANDMMLAARCAEAVGLMRRMLDDTTAHLGQRRQFGVAIGSFQALRHRVADMQLALMRAGALTEAAVGAVEADDAGRGRAVAAACVEVADAVRVVGEGAVQMHGAMGLTEELALGAHFKPALAIGAALGPQAGHLARFVETTA
ncbi:acyl-CoA dehydrogenase family protein [Sphingopyxis panaciterrulae]|uniref:Alkylation response protein AidB-like acyl-CoA dehydrogenase n=1 Tax=Sphingopyxis panaciterrulae TaxID=462372 RepID=A0A7W9B7Y4_9SPHN|nr:acyl-CoA dehydrogenase family protein [Sphingopyxis panaciterrulae]MBB5707890.1 alkylation response protein AidB-like acyl-CoA dehydrogenase [Sphingopyxis panaciterrulae]